MYQYSRFIFMHINHARAANIPQHIKKFPNMFIEYSHFNSIHYSINLKMSIKRCSSQESMLYIEQSSFLFSKLSVFFSHREWDFQFSLSIFLSPLNLPPSPSLSTLFLIFIIWYNSARWSLNKNWNPTDASEKKYEKILPQEWKKQEDAKFINKLLSFAFFSTMRHRPDRSCNSSFLSFPLYSSCICSILNLAHTRSAFTRTFNKCIFNYKIRKHKNR